jgi:hypothetical protein
MLIATLPMLCNAAIDDAPPDMPPPPERASDCIGKSGNAVECFVEQTTFRFLYCKLTVEAVIAGLSKDPMAACAHSGDRSLQDFYAAAMKRFANNEAAQQMTKDYYAFWIAAMGALLPGGVISRSAWREQASKFEAELTQKGERLKLER